MEKGLFEEGIQKKMYYKDFHKLAELVMDDEFLLCFLFSFLSTTHTLGGSLLT